MHCRALFSTFSKKVDSWWRLRECHTSINVRDNATDWTNIYNGARRSDYHFVEVMNHLHWPKKIHLKHSPYHFNICVDSRHSVTCSQERVSLGRDRDLFENLELPTYSARFKSASAYEPIRWWKNPRAINKYVQVAIGHWHNFLPEAAYRTLNSHVERKPCDPSLAEMFTIFVWKHRSNSMDSTFNVFFHKCFTDSTLPASWHIISVASLPLSSIEQEPYPVTSANFFLWDIPLGGGRIMVSEYWSTYKLYDGYWQKPEIIIKLNGTWHF